MIQDGASKCTLEVSEAVSQLLNATPAGEQMQETEWEEVIISEAHILANNVQPEEQGSAPAVIQLQESSVCIDSVEQKERQNEGLETQPSTEVVNSANALSNPTSAVKQTTG